MNSLDMENKLDLYQINTSSISHSTCILLNALLKSLPDSQETRKFACILSPFITPYGNFIHQRVREVILWDDQFKVILR